MDTNLAASYCAEEDYIDMELTSSPQPRDFEFSIFSTSAAAAAPSPADELFYKGKLLPLHLPPRQQMLQNLLPTTTTTGAGEGHHYYSAPCTNTTSTPLDSCNISPSESCRVSCELNAADVRFFEWSDELRSFINNHETKGSWRKKLKQKLVKRSVLVQKLKSSRAYLRSLFFAKSDESSSPSADKYLKIGKKIAAVLKNVDRDGAAGNGHRRSFSGAIKLHSPAKCLSSFSSNSSSSSSSSSSSFNSNGGHELSLIRRSSSAGEIEGSIDAAIAHCKKSLQSFGHCVDLSESKTGDEEVDERGAKV